MDNNSQLSAPPPGVLQRIIAKLRDVSGMAPQQTPGPAMDAMGGFRAANLQRAEQGLPPMTPEEYMRQVSGGQ